MLSSIVQLVIQTDEQNSWCPGCSHNQHKLIVAVSRLCWSSHRPQAGLCGLVVEFCTMCGEKSINDREKRITVDGEVNFGPVHPIAKQKEKKNLALCCPNGWCR